MGNIKTGRLLYVSLCSISRQPMLASLKLKPEVDISELIVAKDAAPGHRIDPGVLNMLNISLTGAVKTRRAAFTVKLRRDTELLAWPWSSAVYFITW